jgi:hypothetical protein
METNCTDYGLEPQVGGRKNEVMKLEAVITCVNHADFLAHTLPHNKPHFDKLIVVTAPEDRQTQKVCDYWGVKYHATDAFNSRWGDFKKGCGINEGLNLLDRTDWLLHLDADIVLPPNTRYVLERADLEPLMVYGVDRVMCPNWEAWQKFISAPEPHTEGNGFFINTVHSGFPLGTRLSFDHEGGYIPVGYFQLWNVASRVTKYVEGHSDAGREDAVFPIQWPRRRRALIPEITAYHLESEPAEMAVNWKKRVTKPFGPPK